MNILGIFAHLDDAEIWAGGTLIKHSTRGDKVETLVFTDSNDIRVTESNAAHRILGANLLIEDPTRGEEATVKKIESIIFSSLPDVIITHWGEDCHPDHRKTFELVNRAIILPWIKTGHPRLLVSTDTYSSMGLSKSFEPNIYVDITSVWQMKMTAIAQFKSQPIHIWQDMITEQNALFGQRVRKDFAEGFLKIPIQGKLSSVEYID